MATGGEGDAASVSTGATEEASTFLDPHAFDTYDALDRAIQAAADEGGADQTREHHDVRHPEARRQEAAERQRDYEYP